MLTSPAIACIRNHQDDHVSRIDGRAAELPLLVAAALWLALAAPSAPHLLETSQARLHFHPVARARETSTDDRRRIVLIGRRLETPLLSTPGRSIIRSDAYRALPEGALDFEPGRYRARTGGKGTLYIEPDRGVLIDYTERGRRGFATPHGCLAGGGARFTGQTRQAQLQHAQNVRHRPWAPQTPIPRLPDLVGDVVLVHGAMRAMRTV